jgi:type I restriction enzyme S subunit
MTDRNGSSEEWDEVPLSELLDSMESGSRPKGGVRHVQDGVLSLGGEHVSDQGDIVLDPPRFVPKDFFQRMNRGHIHAGDILIVKDGATTGKVARVPDNGELAEMVANEHLFVCRPKDEILGRYLELFLRSPEGQRRILEHFRGSAQGGINSAFAAGTKVPVAPKRDQARIVDRLLISLERMRSVETKCGDVERLITRSRAAVAQAAVSGKLTADWREEQPGDARAEETVAQALAGRASSTDDSFVNPSTTLKSVDASDLLVLPDTWTWAKLPDVGFMSRGRSRHRPRNAPHLYGGEYPFIQTGDVSGSGGRITSHRQTYSEAGRAQSRLWPAGTVCITIAANIAESALLTYPACFPDSVVGVVPDICKPVYLELFIRTARADLNFYAPATSQKNINIGILNEVTVPIPPAAEQLEIVARVQAMLTRFDAVEDRIRDARHIGEALRGQSFTRAFVPAH